MDQSSLVGDQIYDGRRFVERFAVDGNPVEVAFWVKTEEEGHWFLYLATDTVDLAGTAATYRAVDAALQKLRDPGVSGSEIKVVSPNDPVARDVLELMAYRTGRSIARLGSRRLGSIDVDQAYVYPPDLFKFTQVNPMTTEDVGREILRLMNRSPGLLHPSRISMKDGTNFHGVPFAIQLGGQKVAEVQFVADGEAAPQVVRLDEIASIA